MKTCKRLSIFAGVVLLALGVAPWANADWNVGDPFKMTVPQLPDPNGIDVRFFAPKVLADDFICSQTGPITDVHFWWSMHRDGQGGPIPVDPTIDPATLGILLGPMHVSIRDDVPAAIDASGLLIPSHPGPLLWARDFVPPEMKSRFWGTGVQSWYDPNTQQFLPDDHHFIWQTNITNIPDPFIQKNGHTYWLDLSALQPQVPVGWKTSRDTYADPIHPHDDDAVWADFGGAGLNWNELRDPRTGFQTSLNLAFVITPEPSSIFMLALGAIALVGCARRGRKGLV
jgi:hypothetical protein